MARKGWDNLSHNYKAGLEKAGISQSAYEQGVSLQAARRHAKTPEHPKSYAPEKFPEYHNRREDLVQRLIEKKAELFGDRERDPKHGPRWNADRSAENIRDHPPSIRLLEWAIEADEEDLLDALREDPETYAFLGYH